MKMDYKRGSLHSGLSQLPLIETDFKNQYDLLTEFYEGISLLLMN